MVHCLFAILLPGLEDIVSPGNFVIGPVAIGPVLRRRQGYYRSSHRPHPTNLPKNPGKDRFPALSSVGRFEGDARNDIASVSVSSGQGAERSI
jgi:hypothetical protein